MQSCLTLPPKVGNRDIGGFRPGDDPEGGRWRKHGKFTDEEMLGSSAEHHGCLSSREIFRRHGTLDKFYRWRRMFGGVTKHKAQRLQTLDEAENARLKRMVVDRAFNIQVLRDSLSRGSDPGRVPFGGHQGPGALRVAGRDSVPLPRRAPLARVVCAAALGSDGAAGARLRARRKEAAFRNPRLTRRLRREGFAVNPKHIARLLRVDDLRVGRRIRHPKRMALDRVQTPRPTRPDERWSVDFARDTSTEGRPFRLWTIVDD